MSIRTAIEINHDFYRQQQKSEFIATLMQALYHGRPKDWENLRLEYGVHRVYDCHHSDDRLEAHEAALLAKTMRLL